MAFNSFMIKIRQAALGSLLPLGLFVLVSAISGTVYIKNIGPFSGPDMHGAHYKASIALATGQNLKEPTKRDFAKVQYIEGSARYLNSGRDCSNNNLVSNIIGSPLVSDGGNSCVANSNKHLDDTHIKVPAVIQYPPLGYIPQAIGIKIGMISGMEPLFAQTLARYLNLMVYMVLIAVSIVLIPRGKWFIAFIGILPPSLFIASSLSADSLNIAWSVLFVAYLMRLYTQKKRAMKRQMLLVFLLGIGLFMLKVAYVPLLIIMLALKPVVIRTKTKWILFFSIALLGSLMYIIWSSNWGSLSALVDTSDQMDLILSNIHKAVLSILLNIYYLPNLLLNSHIMYVVIACIIVVAIAIHVTSAKLVKPKSFVDFLDIYKLQISGAVAIVGSLGLTYAALLLTWTNIGEHGWLNIQGFQGRYIIPLLPVLALVYFLPSISKRRKNDEKKAFEP